ncbi:dockerin type I domain-containing protein [[Eubacterium] hominis]|uniref:dockerin type I domain-containing protein n=1 Tax=[Eubacterium] hominis TaxID=2764325 RepID=UPI003A4E4A81
MKRRSKALFGVSFAGILACSVLTPAHGLFAEEGDNDTKLEGLSYADQTGLFLSMDEDGNVSYVEPEINDMQKELELPEETSKDTTFELKLNFGDESETIGEYDTFEEANAAMTRRSLFRSIGDLEVYSDNQLRASSSYSVVNFNTKDDTTSYTEVNTGTSGYTYGGYAADAAYIGTNSSGTKVKFKMAGVTGWVDKKDVSIVPYSSSLTLSYYAVSNGYLYHYISTNLNKGSTSSTQVVGKAPSYLKSGTKYYSYDGHYFYTSYANMIEDYKVDQYQRSVNKDNPFYNYYQFLSHRTKTTFTADDFNKRVNAILDGGTSKMSNTGAYFIQNQDDYASNASLMFGVAANESAWGQSSIAKNKNNLFGHGAVDSNPYYGATGYESVSDSIKYHAEFYIDKGYTDPADWRYFGAHLGDKSSGMNVKYASDPYWGEKAAAQSYYLEMQSGKQDSSKYSTGVYTGDDAINIRKEPNTSSTILYNTGNGNGSSARVDNYPFVILGEVQGTSVNGNSTWYKVQLDTGLVNDRSSMYAHDEKKGVFIEGYAYNFSRSYGYVNASLITVLTKGTNSNTSDGSSSGGSTGGNTNTDYKKGDVNGDGKISSMDYVLVKNHILNIKKLSGNAAKAADVNGDGKISSMDYVLIKNHILGISQIK